MFLKVIKNSVFSSPVTLVSLFTSGVWIIVGGWVVSVACGAEIKTKYTFTSIISNNTVKQSYLAVSQMELHIHDNMCVYSQHNQRVEKCMSAETVYAKLFGPKSKKTSQEESHSTVELWGLSWYAYTMKVFPEPLKEMSRTHNWSHGKNMCHQTWIWIIYIFMGIN